MRTPEKKDAALAALAARSIDRKTYYAFRHLVAEPWKMHYAIIHHKVAELLPRLLVDHMTGT